MACVMTVCKGENNAREIQSPAPEAIGQAIKDLIPARYFFVILAAKPAIEKCIYIQTLIEFEGRYKGLYLIEVRCQFTGFFNHFRKHVKDADEVKSLFWSFAKGLAPSTIGWEDITAKTLPPIGRRISAQDTIPQPSNRMGLFGDVNRFN